MIAKYRVEWTILLHSFELLAYFPQYTSWLNIHMMTSWHGYDNNITGPLWGESTGPRLNIKTVLSTYGDFHVKDKTAVRTSYL